jgi:mannose-1-phosphate guanylyltransferase
VRAVVLVGGFGTRLRPLTYTIPKPMLPVGHQPIIQRLVANLGRGGVTEVTLALGFKPEPFVEAFPDGRLDGVRLRYAVEPEPLDTAGAIRFAADQAGIDDTFVVVNGDVLTDLDIAALMAFHRRAGAEATIHLIAVDDPSAFGVVELDDGGRVLRFVEKPPPGTEPSKLINAGTYVLEPSVLARIPVGERVSIERSTFPAIAVDGRLFAMPTDDYWVDTGKPDTYLQANVDIVAGRRVHDRCEPVAAGARVAADAMLTDSLVAAGGKVAGRARLVRSVVLDGGVIQAGAVVEDSVVMGCIGANAHVSRLVLGAGATVGDGERVVDARRPEPATA